MAGEAPCEVVLPIRAFNDRRVRGTHLRVMATIGTLGGGPLAHRQISAQCGIADRELRRAIADLIDYGYLSLDHESNAPASYTIIFNDIGGEGVNPPPGGEIAHPQAVPPDVPPPFSPQTPYNPPPLNPPSVIVEAREPDRFAAEFAELWPLFPRKVGKGHALKAYRVARKQTSEETIRHGVMRFAADAMDRDPQFVAHPATWLNGQRWEDEAAPPGREPPGTFPNSPSATLHEGAYLASEAFIRRHQADIFADLTSAVPLLDGERTSPGETSTDRGLARRPH